MFGAQMARLIRAARELQSPVRLMWVPGSGRCRGRWSYVNRASGSQPRPRTPGRELECLGRWGGEQVDKVCVPAPYVSGHLLWEDRESLRTEKSG